jgi:hypothetical protein
LPVVVAAVGCGTPVIDAATERVIERDGRRVGVLRYHIRRKTSDAIIDLIATPAADARRGVGMTAVALVEHELRASGARRAYAPAPESHGIAMYFWIRLGYRPLMRPAWPCERDGIAWLVREF